MRAAIFFAAFLIAQVASEDAGAAKVQVPGEVQNAAGAVAADLRRVFNAQRFQGQLAALAFIFGLFIVAKGHSTFKLIASLAIGFVAFCFMTTQLHNDAATAYDKLITGVASLEVGAFVGLTAYLGWGGTQLVMGGALGVYIGKFAASVVRDGIAESPTHLTILFTVSILLGTWLINEKGAGAKAVAIVTSLCGGSLVSSAICWMIMFSATTPAGGSVVNPSDMPCLQDFWTMIVYPFRDNAVGLGTYTHSIPIRIQFDKLLGLFLWAVFTYVGVKVQSVGISVKAKEQSLVAPLLEDETA